MRFQDLRREITRLRKTEVCAWFESLGFPSPHRLARAYIREISSCRGEKRLREKRESRIMPREFPVAKTAQDMMPSVLNK